MAVILAVVLPSTLLLCCRVLSFIVPTVAPNKYALLGDGGRRVYSTLFLVAVLRRLSSLFLFVLSVLRGTRCLRLYYLAPTCLVVARTFHILAPPHVVHVRT